MRLLRGLLLILTLGATVAAAAAGPVLFAANPASVAEDAEDDTLPTLLVQWKFEEPSGTEIADASGNAHTGTLVNAPLLVAGPNASFPNARHFNGSSRHMTTPHAADLSLAEETFAVTAWIKVDTAHNNDAAIYGKWGLGDTHGWYVTVRSAVGPRQGELCLVTSAGAVCTVAGAVPLDTWTHVVVVRETVSMTRFAVNGVLFLPGDCCAAQPRTASATVANTSPFTVGTVGKLTPSSQLFARVQVADLRLYSGLLTTSEAAAVYANSALPSRARFATRCDSLKAEHGAAIVSCWSFDDPEEAALISSSLTPMPVPYDETTTGSGTGGGSLYFNVKSFDQILAENPSFTNGQAYRAAFDTQDKVGLWRRWLGHKYGKMPSPADEPTWTHPAFAPGETYYYQYRMKFTQPWLTGWGSQSPKLGPGMGDGGCRIYNGERIPARCPHDIGTSGSMEAVVGVFGNNDFGWPPQENAHTWPIPFFYHGATNFQNTHSWISNAPPNAESLYQPGWDTRGTWDDAQATWLGGCHRHLAGLSEAGWSSDPNLAATLCQTMGAVDEWHEFTFKIKTSGNWTKQRYATGFAITGASNATPIVVTLNTKHNLRAGDSVNVTGVGGNTAANGLHIVTNPSASAPWTFELYTAEGQPVAGSNPYTSGGSASFAGPYYHDNVVSIWYDGVNILNLDNDANLPPFRAGQPTPAECAEIYSRGTSAHKAAFFGNYHDCHTGVHLWRLETDRPDEGSCPYPGACSSSWWRTPKAVDDPGADLSAFALGTVSYQRGWGHPDRCGPLVFEATTTGTLTSGSAVITAVADTTGFLVGQQITTSLEVQGQGNNVFTGEPLAKITAVDSGAGTITVNRAASVTQAVTLYTGGADFAYCNQNWPSAPPVANGWEAFLHHEHVKNWYDDVVVSTVPLMMINGQLSKLPYEP